MNLKDYKARNAEHFRVGYRLGGQDHQTIIPRHWVPGFAEQLEAKGATNVIIVAIPEGRNG